MPFEPIWLLTGAEVAMLSQIKNKKKRARVEAMLIELHKQNPYMEIEALFGVRLHKA